MEIFKIIPEFPDYLVSNFGRVKTKSRLLRYVHAVTKKEHFRKSEERFLKIQFNNLTGYKFCQLYKNNKMSNKTLHNLVANTFIENQKKLPCINHIDGNKHNNCVDNLEWCSNEYNHKHATETGLKAKGEQIKSSILNENSQLLNSCKGFAIQFINEDTLHADFESSIVFGKSGNFKTNRLFSVELDAHAPVVAY